MTLFIGETIERMGKREEWSHEILIARFLTVVRACDREFANGTRLSTAPSFPPLEERGGDRSRKVTPPQLVSLSPSRISPCASRVGRWQCTGGLAPDTPYAVTLSQPRGILLCTSACNSRTILPSLFSPLLFSRLRFATGALIFQHIPTGIYLLSYASAVLFSFEGWSIGRRLCFFLENRSKHGTLSLRFFHHRSTVGGKVNEVVGDREITLANASSHLRSFHLLFLA